MLICGDLRFSGRLDNTVHSPQHHRQTVISSCRRRLVERAAVGHNLSEDFLVPTLVFGHSYLTVVLVLRTSLCSCGPSSNSCYLGHVKPFCDDDDECRCKRINYMHIR